MSRSNVAREWHPEIPRRRTASPPILAHLQEVLENLGPVLGVLDLWVELQAEEGTVVRPHRLARAVLAVRKVREPWGDDGDLVVVALPNLERLRQALEEDILLP